jgi:hypothetical protein
MVFVCADAGLVCLYGLLLLIHLLAGFLLYYLACMLACVLLPCIVYLFCANLLVTELILHWVWYWYWVVVGIMPPVFL